MESILIEGENTAEIERRYMMNILQTGSGVPFIFSNVVRDYIQAFVLDETSAVPVVVPAKVSLKNAYFLTMKYGMKNIRYNNKIIAVHAFCNPVKRYNRGIRLSTMGINVVSLNKSMRNDFGGRFDRDGLEGYALKFIKDSMLFDYNTAFMLCKAGAAISCAFTNNLSIGNYRNDEDSGDELHLTFRTTRVGRIDDDGVVHLNAGGAFVFDELNQNGVAVNEA